MGVGYPDTPGIWSAEQIEGWKLVTRAVHEAGGRILLQLWHVGRISDPLYLDGQSPVSASAVRPAGHVSLVRPMKNFETPRALLLEEIPAVVETYRRGAQNAQAAGFDGVEIHGANGYLIDQFLRDNTNLREDEYGGSPENRIRFMKEAVQAVIAVAGAERTSIRLSPNGETQGADDSNPEAVFVPAAKALDELGISFLELREQSPEGTFGASSVPKLSPLIRKAFTRPLVLNQDYTLEKAQADLDSGIADAIAFGRPFIGNPDLVERLRKGVPLAQDNPKTWYSKGPEGYIDYPAYEAQAA
jgi:2,4-dienoyl-CoA reductase-like NADH-dependent reductase (Old Yellow Enzyme family)